MKLREVLEKMDETDVAALRGENNEYIVGIRSGQARKHLNEEIRDREVKRIQGVDRETVKIKLENRRTKR